MSRPEEQAATPEPLSPTAPTEETPPSPATHPVGAMQDQLRDAMGATRSGRGAGLMAVPVTLRAVLGEARMPVSRFLDLEPGDTLSLDRMVGDPIEVTVNDQVVAHGEIVMLDEETGQLGVRVVALSGQ